MFKKIEKLKNITTKKNVEIDLKNIKLGINLLENFIIYKKEDDIKIFERKCDHAGGKLISKGNDTFCPIHMWKFDPSTGLYSNGIKKKQIPYSINKKVIKINDISYKPEIISSKIKQETEIRFFNHAFLKIAGKNFSFCTDPWAIGPAFNTGWWLKHPTKNDWLEELNNSSFVYISHNHPDHLHPLTLNKMNKKIPIVVPNFISQSTKKYIQELGFKNIQELEFNMQYNLIGTALNISILKSGDFREDSGIYFSHGEFTGLLSVDANMINFERFPNVDFFGSSFAGGASGYPLMLENYQLNEQIEITLKNKNFVKNKLLSYLKKIQPSYFMPYAGFFSEKLKRDIKIKKNNKKNLISDYNDFCKKNNIIILDVLENDTYNFQGKKLQNQAKNTEKNTKDLPPEIYLDYYKKEFAIVDEEYIRDYFISSEFKDNLLLYIRLTDDEFKPLGKDYFVDFSNEKIIFKNIDFHHESPFKDNENLKKLVLKVRKESFLNTVYNKLPWEDLSIGFQCQIQRQPNVYNVNFWHHFTNIYITSKNVRTTTECSSCDKINQFFDSQINQHS